LINSTKGISSHEFPRIGGFSTLFPVSAISTKRQNKRGKWGSLLRKKISRGTKIKWKRLY
jgi:hypothetical protein